MAAVTAQASAHQSPGRESRPADGGRALLRSLPQKEKFPYQNSHLQVRTTFCDLSFFTYFIHYFFLAFYRHPTFSTVHFITATIAARYDDAMVDELLKPDADIEVFKERLLELRKRVKRDIYAWTKSFVNEFQRQPNKQERKDVGGAMFKAYSGVRTS